MTKIYISYHAPAYIVANQVLTPVQVGRANSKTKLEMIGDDIGNNISQKNDRYCEITAQYWVWKNGAKSNYVGFMHYRRYFDFRSVAATSNKAWAQTEIDHLDEKFSGQYGLTEENIESVISGFDIIVPEYFDVREAGAHSLEEHYSHSKFHHAADLEALGGVLRSRYPQDYKYFENVIRGAFLLPANMFIMKWQHFEKYSAWLFPLLSDLDEILDLSTYSKQERRVIGYLSERLLTVYMAKITDENRALKTRQLNRLFVRNTNPPPMAPDVPHTNLPVVNVVTASDQNYLPHLSAFLASLLSNASKKHFIDVIVLDGGIRPADSKTLLSLQEMHPSCRISFMDMSSQYLDIPVHLHFTRSTFYRLSMPDLLTNRDRVLYLDSDMVVLGDVCELYNTNLEGKLIGAVQDLIMLSFTAKGVKSLYETGAVPAKIYLAEYLGMGSRGNEYFQAGTMIFDLKGMRQTAVSRKMTEDLRQRVYWFVDQDVLNKNFLGNVKFIDPKWNVIGMNDDHFLHLAAKDQDAYLNSVGEPCIVHFAGGDKPWHNLNNPFGHYYWYYLRKTPWYEVTFTALLRQQIKWGSGPSLLKRSLERIWEKLPTGLQRAIMPFADFIDRHVK